MRTCDGLSLTEVLVSLLIVTGASLTLIKQQWHVSRFTQHLIRRNEVVFRLDNASEQIIEQRAYR